MRQFIKNKEILYCIITLSMVAIWCIILLKHNVVLAETKTIFSEKMMVNAKELIKKYIGSDKFIIPAENVKDIQGIKLSGMCKDRISRDFISYIIQEKLITTVTEIKDYTKLCLLFDSYLVEVYIPLINSLKESIPLEIIESFRRELHDFLISIITQKQFFINYCVEKETTLLTILQWFFSFIWLSNDEFKILLVDRFLENISVYLIIMMDKDMNPQNFIELFLNYILREEGMVILKITIMFSVSIYTIALGSHISFPIPFAEFCTNLINTATHAIAESAMTHPEATENIGIVTPGYHAITQQVVDTRDICQDSLDKNNKMIIVFAGVTVMGLYLLKKLYWP